MIICDFCSGFPVVARYHAADFAVVSGPLVQESVGDWAACALCEKLIDRGQWDDLVTHVMATGYEKHYEMRFVPADMYRQFLQTIYAELRKTIRKSEKAP